LRIHFFIFLAIVCAGLSACLSSPDCVREDVFCAGLVTNTASIKDFGLNQLAWEGLQQARRDKVVDHAAYIESVDARDYAKNIEVFADANYDVIITIGPALDDETLQAADIYADSVFIGIDQPQEETRPNLLPIVFAEDQMGFWAGTLAARITQTGTIGAVCETSGIDSMWRYCEGFRKGAAYADEDVQALILYREGQSSERLFIDAEWGDAAARDLIGRGADVIFAAGGGTAQGALLAAARADVRAIGAERDQARALSEAAPALVTSVYGGTSSEVQNWMRFLREGNHWEGAASGSLTYAPYSDIESRVSESLKGEMQTLLGALMTGAIRTDVPPSAP
jgi:basic membrane protein A